jgi:DNA repair exonuclease SbcCD ATPase subunit
MNSNTRIIGAIAVLLLISILTFEASGVGLSAFLQMTNKEAALQTMSDANYFSLVLETTAIIVLAIILAIVMFTLFSSASLEAGKRRKLDEVTRDIKEQHQDVSDSIEAIKKNTEQSEQMISKLQQKFTVLDKLHGAAEVRGKDLEETAEKLYSYERDLRHSADSISNRLEHVQTYWDEQLGETVDTVKRIKQSLSGGLVQVEEGVSRIKEQEGMAQDFTKKLIKTYEEQAEAQRETNRITSSVRENLEATLAESNQLLGSLQGMHQNAEDTFRSFSTQLEGYESQAYDQFEDLFANIDTARKELNAGLEESDAVLTQLREKEQASREITDKVSNQIEQLEVDRVRILTNALDEASEMCDTLKRDMDDARHVLHGLTPIKNTGKVDEVLEEVLEKEAAKDEEDAGVSNDKEMPEDSRKDKTPFSNHYVPKLGDVVPARDFRNSDGHNNKLVSFFSRR